MPLTAFASREPAAYIKGTTLRGDESTSEMLAAAGLNDWHVRLRTVESDALRASESFEVIRDLPDSDQVFRLGISGERYVEIQNEDIFNMFSGFNPIWDAAGSFKNGTTVYAQCRTESKIVLDPNGAADEIQPLIHISTGHGGSGALRIGRSAQRLECFNMFTMIFRNLQGAVTIKHTKSAESRMKDVLRTWKENDAYFAQVEAEANALYAAKATDKQFWAIVDKFQGERPDANVKGSQTKYDNRREVFAQAWNGEPNAKAKGTAWGVFQALIEANQWGRTVQKTDAGLDNFAMAGMGFDIPTNNFRQNAYEAAKSLV